MQDFGFYVPFRFMFKPGPLYWPLNTSILPLRRIWAPVEQKALFLPQWFFSTLFILCIWMNTMQICTIVKDQGSLAIKSFTIKWIHFCLATNNAGELISRTLIWPQINGCEQSDGTDDVLAGFMTLDRWIWLTEQPPVLLRLSAFSE